MKIQGSPCTMEVDSSTVPFNLFNYLFNHWVTLWTTTGCSPTEFFMGQHLTTHCDLLYPNRTSDSFQDEPICSWVQPWGSCVCQELCKWTHVDASHHSGSYWTHLLWGCHSRWMDSASMRPKSGTASQTLNEPYHFLGPTAGLAIAQSCFHSRPFLSGSWVFPVQFGAAKLWDSCQ